MNANRIMGGGPAFQKGIADKPKMKTTQILKRLWKYLYHFKWFLFLALFMTLTSNILALTVPSFLVWPSMPSTEKAMWNFQRSFSTVV